MLLEFSHLAGGGDKKIFSQKVDFSTVTSRINSKGNTYPSMCHCYYCYICMMIVVRSY